MRIKLFAASISCIAAISLSGCEAGFFDSEEKYETYVYNNINKAPVYKIEIIVSYKNGEFKLREKTINLIDDTVKLNQRHTSSSTTDCEYFDKKTWFCKTPHWSYEMRNGVIYFGDYRGVKKDWRMERSVRGKDYKMIEYQAKAREDFRIEEIAKKVEIENKKIAAKEKKNREKDSSQSGGAFTTSLRAESQIQFANKVMVIAAARSAADAGTRESEIAYKQFSEFWAGVKGMEVAKWRCRYVHPYVWESSRGSSLRCGNPDRMDIVSGFSDEQYSLNLASSFVPNKIYKGDLITFSGTVIYGWGSVSSYHLGVDVRSALFSSERSLGKKEAEAAEEFARLEDEKVAKKEKKILEKRLLEETTKQVKEAERRAAINPDLQKESVESVVGYSAIKYKKTNPLVYPNSARRKGWEGKTLLIVLVDKQGLPEKLEILTSSGHADLDNAAIESVKTWQFYPAIRNGVAVSGYVRIPINFKLAN